MKKYFFTGILALIFTCMFAGSSQTKNITWLGIDFSHVKVIGETPKDFQQKFFPDWNMLFVSEASKYDLKSTFRVKEVSFAVDSVGAKNYATPSEGLIGYDTPPAFTKDEISKYVNAYSFPVKDGIGAMLFAECLNKAKKVCYFDVVILNLQTKEILFQDRLKGEPGGWGTRSYWANAIKDVLDAIHKKKYKF